MVVKVITVATHEKGYFKELIWSAKKQGFTPVVLGMGEEWGGFVWRLKKLLEYISTLDPNEIIVFVDGYDTLCLKSVNVLMNRFLSLKKNIVISTGPESYNVLHWYVNYRIFGYCYTPGTTQDSQGATINMGMYMGYAGYLNQLLDMVCKRYNCSDSTLDDQHIMTEMCNDTKDFFSKNVLIDTQCLIFKNIMPKSLFTIDPGDITPGQAIFVQGPGNTNLDGILKAYGIPKLGQTRDSGGYILNALKHYSKFFIPEMLVFFILSLIVYYFSGFKGVLVYIVLVGITIGLLSIPNTTGRMTGTLGTL